MVGLLNSHLTSPENNPKKMSDTSELVDKDMETDNIKELPKTKDVDNELPKKPEEAMDVDDDKSESASSDKATKNDKPTNEATTARRKSRSSRSASTNSSSSGVPTGPQETKDNKDKKKPEVNSEEEDFFGFDLAESEKVKLESSVDQYKKALDMDVSSGFETPSTSTRKGPRASKKTPSIDLSSQEYRKPFEYGWVRELVYRSTTDNSLRRNADIYYYTPSGKKVRSSREILEHLTGDLTLDNFTFFKGAIGVDDPSKEIIREAKAKPGPRGGSFEDAVTTPVKKPTPKVKQMQTSPKETPKILTPKVVFRGNTTPKGRPQSGKAKLDKKRKSAGPDDIDVMVDAEDWSPDAPKVNANGLKRPFDSPTTDKEPGQPEKKTKVHSRGHDRDEEVIDLDDDKDEHNRLAAHVSGVAAPTAQNFMMNLNAGFIALLHAFQYLRVYELLRAGHVSKMWQFVASHHSLWETVRMKNSRVSDWKGFGRTLSSRGTKFLDLRKMLVPESPEEQAKMWEELCKAVEGIKTLTKVDMGRCSPSAFVAMAEAAPQLESLVSLAINWKDKSAVPISGSQTRGNEIDLLNLSKCKNLKELRLKTVTGTLEIKDLSVLNQLTNLTTLGLTTIKNLKGIENYLPENLTQLELGECSMLSKEVATVALPKLVKLKRLRLEKGQGECPTLALLSAVSALPELKQLELINFDIKPGFDKALAKCTNLKTLLIIPTYVTQSATTNHVVMGGVAKLSQTLQYFIWGLTLELLKVTDLFIGQVENQKSGKTGGPNPGKKGSGDSIPILKPSSSEGGDLKDGSQAPSQVDILALPNLQRVLSTLLPTTKIKILKVPFSATWRQTVTDG